jgi:hypothetical protein
MAAGCDDVLAEAAGIRAGSWYAWRPNRNPRGRIRHAIRSSETTLGYNPPANHPGTQPGKRSRGAAGLINSALESQ